ncbi:hypothetical protein WE348_23105 (plasmid) [Alteromonas macleodii]|uniref:Uncharacterized protein n=1 Tax=Alteromonas macleodii TaxID=28108 RepID=A0AB36FMX8_ALTMA|nr:hypothetical protein [Alteromonas macleodii]OES24327.1 hypothetical protein BFV94_4824 [Alteromonas macleodii]OES24664.1 hypothetical protein BFV95_4690 [Alteromonas macleodii]OES24932.1 hypothetical protein BFV93_4641 [Alteromonas macleodii]OES38566.1 hypothetical protein BFV96_4853 [Alteromonas macleodii]|tara:strand:+ start:12911 stop:13099 length:189 start_codon:yes stop_codon:yes gene_type:complete
MKQLFKILSFLFTAAFKLTFGLIGFLLSVGFATESPSQEEDFEPVYREVNGELIAVDKRIYE